MLNSINFGGVQRRPREETDMKERKDLLLNNAEEECDVPLGPKPVIKMIMIGFRHYLEVVSGAELKLVETDEYSESRRGVYLGGLDRMSL